MSVLAASGLGAGAASFDKSGSKNDAAPAVPICKFMTDTVPAQPKERKVDRGGKNDRKWPEMTGNDRKRPEMTEHDRKRPEMTEHDRK
jgi:hypothetical protein